MKILGLDIGGTALKWGIKENGSFTDTGTCPSYAKEGAERLLSNIYELLDGKEFDMLGVSTAGIVANDGSILYANENIPRYTGTPLAELLRERYSVPVTVVNDIAAAAYSERARYADYYYVALGTGVGGIHVKDGVIMSGKSGIAGQIGYLSSSCGGIIDLDASTRGLAILCGGDVPKLFAAATDGDVKANETLDKWCAEIAHVLTGIVGYINPEVIVIGGGVSEQGELLLSKILAQSQNMPLPYRDSFKLVCAKGGNLAAVEGIIDYVKELNYDHS